ncbi:MAG: hypothetical protein DYG88_14460 [Chloroflexi bacterium CFX4]|nr:hypothetical protein [Chloroflexi bacterium CFX4]MDL1923808.1 hypothetical protein [Chloroflexi bacterium CFX3]
MNTHTNGTLSIFTLLAALYFAVFTGHPISGDERLLFDAARSLATHGSFALVYSSDQRPFFGIATDQIVPSADVEPLQAFLSAPLVIVARLLPNIGMAHTVWLFNVLVTALTGALLYAYGRQLGYGVRSAAAVALIFGVGTVAFPYAQMYFREPLLGLCGLAAAYLTERWRANPRRLGWLVAAFGAVLAAVFTKQAGVLFALAPLLAVVGVSRHQRRLWLPLLISGALLAVIALLRWDSTVGRLLSPERLARAAESLPEALPAYLISPGFSLWVFSPILVVSLFGALHLLRKRQWHSAALPALILLGFAVGHPLLHSDYWYGGLAWGTRFLVPVTPLLCLWLLPVAESFFAGQRLPRLTKFALGSVLLLSIAVQVVAISLPATRYGVALAKASQREGRQIVAWREGVWDVRYQPIWVMLRQIGSVPSAVAWDVVHVGGVVLPLCALSAAVALIGMRRWRAAWLGVALLLITFYVGLRAVYADPRYGGDNPDLWAALGVLEGTLYEGDVLLVNSDAYRPFITNYYKSTQPVYVIPTPEGESVDPVNPPAVVSTNPEERANPYFQQMFARIAQRSNRWLFLTEYNPYTPNRYRVTEAFLARHYFPAEELLNTPSVRLLSYAPISAPPMSLPPFPRYAADANFGVATLIGFDLPHGTRYHAGDFLPISLLWRAEGFPPDLEPLDYSINLSLINAEGAAAAQRVAQPRATFGGFTLWEAGALYRDHHALHLPANLPRGRYQVWLLITDWRDGSALPLRDGSGQHSILIEIEIE